MYTTKDFESVKDIIIRDIPEAQAIILFGSYARGEAGESSDMDFLILTDKEYNRKDKLKILANLRWDIAVAGFDADVLLKERAKYLADIETPTLARTIQKEGTILWQK